MNKWLPSNHLPCSVNYKLTPQVKMSRCNAKTVIMYCALHKLIMQSCNCELRDPMFYSKRQYSVHGHNIKWTLPPGFLHCAIKIQLWFIVLFDKVLYFSHIIDINCYKHTNLCNYWYISSKSTEKQYIIFSIALYLGLVRHIIVHQTHHLGPTTKSMLKYITYNNDKYPGGVLSTKVVIGMCRKHG